MIRIFQWRKAIVEQILASEEINPKDDMLIEHDEIKSYSVPVFNINDVKLHPKINILKNNLGEMRKCETFLVMYVLEK